MNLKPIVEQLSKKAFTIPGLEDDDMIMLGDVIEILRQHFGVEDFVSFYKPEAEEAAMLKKKYTKIPIQHVNRQKPPSSVIIEKDVEEEKKSFALPENIQFLLKNKALGPSALDEHTGNTDKQENPATPNESGNGETI
jgi:hypothetical protein